MPGASIYDPHDKHIREASRVELMERQRVIKDNRQYYDGDMPRPLLDDKDNVILNLCRQVVDETVSFLVPDMPQIELDDTAGVGGNETEAWLQDAWVKSGGATLLSSMASNGALGGQVFAQVLPNGDGPPSVLNLNPLNVIKFWDQDDINTVLWYEIHWSERASAYTDAKRWRQDIVWADGQRWEIITYREGTNGGTWVEHERIDWLYPLGPIVDWQHLTRANMPYGEHELPHRGLNDAVNKVASDIQSILRYHAFPTTVGTGFSADELQKTSVDGFLTVPDAAARVYNVEMQSDLASSMNMLDMLSKRFFSQSRVVVVSGGPDAYRGMTNLGIKAAFMPMISKNESLRRNYSRGIQQISKRLLMLRGLDYTAFEPRVEWGSALPMDEREEITNAQSLMAMGLMSKETAAGRFGLDWQTEMNRQIDEAINEGVQVSGFPMGVSG